MISLKKKNKKKSKKIGIEAVVRPGYEALYVRGNWRKKLKDITKRKGKPKKFC